MTTFLKDNPRRPADWRWQRASSMVEDGERLSRKRDDEWTRKSVHFLRAFDNCETDAHRRALAESDSDMYWAYDIYQAEGDPTRIELEARLLAHDDYENISKSLCLPVKAIEAYEQVFFNVADRYENSGYIFHQIIGRAMHRGLSEREFEALWKLYGYLYGPHMLESLISQSVDVRKPQNAKAVEAAWRDDGKHSLLRKQAIAARTIPVNNFTQSEILSLYAKFVEVEKGMNISQTESTIVANIEAMVSSLPWGVGRRVTGVDAPAVAAHDANAAELRDEEMLQLAVGEVPADMDDIANLSFPEVESDEKN